jgi:dihydroneopterin aldolase
MDDIGLAFQPPHLRAAATREDRLPDRISLREHVRSVEIGAFAAERGLEQRLRFDVVLEVGATGRGDDVDRILSYDTIVAAIDAALASERLNLLETLAERIAAGCLRDPRAARAFVRIEKLDRVPGALGVEIVRSRHEVAPPASVGGSGSLSLSPAPLVLYLPRAVHRGAGRQAWLEAAIANRRAPLLVLDPADPQPRAEGEASLRVGLLAMEQAAWALAAADRRYTVAGSRAEIDWARRAGRPAIWAPCKLVLDAVPRPAGDASDAEALGIWLALTIGASHLHVVGGTGRPGTVALDRAAPEALAACE